MIDTHTHLNFRVFDDLYRQVIQRSQMAGLRLINVGAQLATSKKAVAIAGEFPETCFTAIGLHPIHVLDEEWNQAEFRQLAGHPSVVAVGETGLDAYRVPDGADPAMFRTKQEELLLAHMKLAQEFAKPLMIHCREAYDDLLAFLKQHEGLLRPLGQPRGQVHCYVGDWPTAQQFIELGFVIGFTGIVTFTNDEKLLEVVDKIADGSFVVETDAPYLAPVPMRGKQNEPLLVKHVIEFVAKRRGVEPSAIDEQTTATAQRVFSLPA